VHTDDLWAKNAKAVGVTNLNLLLVRTKSQLTNHQPKNQRHVDAQHPSPPRLTLRKRQAVTPLANTLLKVLRLHHPRNIQQKRGRHRPNLHLKRRVVLIPKEQLLKVQERPLNQKHCTRSA
jgi:hypothetical protein